MRKLLKIVAAVLVVAMAVPLFSGCGGSSRVAENEIVFWHPYGGPSEKDILEEMVSNYNAMQDEVVVRISYIADLETKLQTVLAGGDVPDVVYFNRSNTLQWSAQGLFYDLTDLVARDGINSTDFYDYAWNEAVYKDRVYGIPLSADNRMLFYNKQMFRDAGLDPEKPPKTFAELDEYARKMTKKSGNTYDQMGFIPWADMGSIITWGFAFGGEFQNKDTLELTPNNPQIIQSMDWMKSYADEYGLVSISSFFSNASELVTPFNSKKLGMCVCGSWMLSFLDEIEGLDYGIAPLPSVDGSESITWGGGYSMIIPHNSKKAEMAWDFIKYATVGEGAQNANKWRTFFSAYKSFNDDWVTEDARYQIFLDAMDHCKSRPLSPIWEYCEGQLNTAVDKFLRNKGEASELLDKVKTNCDEKLQEYLNS